MADLVWGQGQQGGKAVVGPATPKPNASQRYGIMNFLDSMLTKSQYDYQTQVTQQNALALQAAKDQADMARQKEMIDAYYKPSVDVEREKLGVEREKNAAAVETSKATIEGSLREKIIAAYAQAPDEASQKALTRNPVFAKILMDAGLIDGSGNKTGVTTPGGAPGGASAGLGAGGPVIKPQTPQGPNFWGTPAGTATAIGGASLLPKLPQAAAALGRFGAGNGAALQAIMRGTPAAAGGLGAASVGAGGMGLGAAALPIASAGLLGWEGGRAIGGIPVGNNKTIDDMVQEAFVQLMKSQPQSQPYQSNQNYKGI